MGKQVKIRHDGRIKILQSHYKLKTNISLGSAHNDSQNKFFNSKSYPLLFQLLTLNPHSDRLVNTPVIFSYLPNEDSK